MKKNSIIFIAGHKGLVGSAVLRKLKTLGYKKIVTASKNQLNLLDQKKTFDFLKKKKPEFMFICAAKVGGILANDKYRADFIYENLQIQNNLIHGAFINNVKKLIFLGSSCVYPNSFKRHILEKDLLTSGLEKTNEPYAIAKIAGIKLCENYMKQYKKNFICLMPTNTFGPGDNYDLNKSHFIPALIKKIHLLKKHNGKILKIWGSGKVKREVIFVDDLAEACIFFMKKKVQNNLINIGTGKDYSINWYAKEISRILKVKTILVHDKTKPDGTKRKVLNINLAKKYGWKPRYSFQKSILETYKSFIKN